MREASGGDPRLDESLRSTLSETKSRGWMWVTGRRKGFKCLSDDRCEWLGSKGEEEWEVTCEEGV